MTATRHIQLTPEKKTQDQHDGKPIPLEDASPSSLISPSRFSTASTCEGDYLLKEFSASPSQVSQLTDLEDLDEPCEPRPIDSGYSLRTSPMGTYAPIGKLPAKEAEFTLRAVFVGLLVGVLLCFTNTYFGLQTGWITMGSIQSAVVGFGFCKLSFPKDRPLTSLENVVLQTVSVATATMPLTGGFVGIIPALQMLDPPVVLSWQQQLCWCGALTYFGVFAAVPLRRQTILEEKLPFPSGTATAKVIEFLHASESDGRDLELRWLSLSWSFAASFALAFVCFVWTAASNLAIGNWIGLPILSRWHWTLRPTLSYVGQGMIMGPKSVLSMFLGAVIAWALLGPFANRVGWAPGDVESWTNGSQGWLLWVAIGLMLGEALSFFLLSISREFGAIADNISRKDSGEEATKEQLVPSSWWMSGAFASLVVCAAIISPLFSIPIWQVVLAVSLSCLTAVLAVRALGQTDLNPVTGVAKISQLLFALVAPGQMVTNIVAGAMVEASAQQAGDVMQALKTGHLLGSSPRAQFYATLVGSTVSVFVSVGAFQMYQGVYGIPSAQFGVPVAHVWLEMAYLMKEGVGALPSSALQCATVAFGIGGMLPILEHVGTKFDYSFRHYIPSGVAMGIGMYLTPDWTLPRVWGVLVTAAWSRLDMASFKNHHIMVASGFVIGEVVMSLISLCIKALQK
jgi:putative OPT family oligopeptide transporter